MDEQIGTDTLQFQIRHTTPQLYLALVAIWIRKPWFYVLLSIIVGLPASFLIAGAILGSVDGFPWGALPGVAILASIPYIYARAAMKQLGVAAGFSYGFSPQGFSSKSNQAATSYLWTAVKGVRENRRFIFIELTGGSAHVIPLRQITTDQAEQLRSLLRTHVSKNVHLATR